ncbi:MAG: lysophospholipid acyltransferase family protein, partial [Dehalococcoidia bacterium]
GIWAAANVIAPLPTWLGLFVTDSLATINFYLARKTRAIVEENLKHVLGDDVDRKTLRRVTRQAFRNLGRNYYDLARVPRMSRRKLEERVVFHGLEHLEAARRAGRGVIVASAHLGNLDLVMQASQLIGMDVVVLAEQLTPKKVHDLVMSLRGKLGLSFEPAGAGGVKAAFRALKQGKFVGLACDRVIHGQGIETSFFGKPALMPMGAADMALRTGATILPSFSVRAGRDRYNVFFDPPIFVSKNGRVPEQVRALTDRIIVVMERYIRENPAQWMAFDPIWDRRDDPTTPVELHETAVDRAA